MLFEGVNSYRGKKTPILLLRIITESKHVRSAIRRMGNTPPNRTSSARFRVTVFTVIILRPRGTPYRAGRSVVFVSIIRRLSWHDVISYAYEHGATVNYRSAKSATRSCPSWRDSARHVFFCAISSVVVTTTAHRFYLPKTPPGKYENETCEPRAIDDPVRMNENPKLCRRPSL